MTWAPVDKLTCDETASLLHIILYGAIEGMEGASLKELIDENGGIKYEGYWHGCVETAARSLAFLFAGSAIVDGVGIGVSDTVDIIAPYLDEAAQLLMGSPECPHCKRLMEAPSRSTTQDQINNAERCVDQAAVKFLIAYIPQESFALTIASAIQKRQRDREIARGRNSP